MKKNEKVNLPGDMSDFENMQDQARSHALEQGVEERELMHALDTIIMESDLPLESIERVLNYLAHRHLDTRLQDQKPESPLESILSMVQENLPDIIRAANAPKISPIPLTPMRAPMPEKPKE